MMPFEFCSLAADSRTRTPHARRNRNQYLTDLDRAVQDVKNDILTPTQAHKVYNIQPWIIKKNLSRVDANHARLTRVEVPDDWEPEIVEHCLEMLQARGSLTRNDIATKVRVGT